MHMNVYEAKWTTASRKAHKANGGYFAGPRDSFHLKDASDVSDAYGLAGHADNPDQVRANIISWAKKNGHADALPDTAKESAPTQLFEAKDRIARIKSYFIEDNATSLNGRKYQKEAADKLIQSIKTRLIDPNALPMTCYTSHEDADGGITRNITGKVSGAGKEGTKGYVWLDVPDTQAGHESLTLAKGGYIRSQSLRASGARMYLSKESDVPLVGGDLQFEVIDWTTTPGLPQVARIADITESNEPQDLNEVFHSSNLLVEEVPVDPKDTDKLKEETLEPLTSGVTQGVAPGPTQDDYAKRTMKMAPDAPTAVFPEALSNVHDHIAAALGMDCAPSTMERVASLKYLGIQEAGAKFSAKTARHLGAAHDGIADHLQKPCAGKGITAGNNMDSDGDTDNSAQENKTYKKQEIALLIKDQLEAQRILEGIRSLPHSEKQVSQPATEQKKEDKPMTPEEAQRLLQEAGYEVKAPKTEEEKFQEALDAKIAEKMNAMQAAFDAKIEEVQKKTLPLNRFSAPPQRKSLVEGATTTEGTPKKTYYKNGDYLRNQLANQEFREQLLDRSRPLPKEMNKEHLVNELKKELLGMFDAKWGLTGSMDSFF